MQALEELQLWAWVGEHTDGVTGIKRVLCYVPGLNTPVYTPLATMRAGGGGLRDFKVDMEPAAVQCGKKIRLVRFIAVEVVDQTEHGT